MKCNCSSVIKVLMQIVLSMCMVLPLFVFIIPLSLFCTPLTTWLSELNTSDPEVVRELERIIGIKFPESTEWINAEAHQWMGMYCDIECTIPESDIFVMFPKSDYEWDFQLPNMSITKREIRLLKINLYCSEIKCTDETMGNYIFFEKTRNNNDSCLRVLVDLKKKKDSPRLHVYIKWMAG